MKLITQTARLLLLCALFSTALLAYAQLSPETQEALRRGKTAAAQALNSYEKANPDQPFWEEALAYGEEAARLAPDAPEPQRFLAQVYTSLGWFKRAYDAWEQYEQFGGELDADARTKFAEMSTSLGYSRYTQDDLTAALGYYRKANDISSSDQTLTWLALINFELGRPQAALPYWQQVTQRQPDNPLYALYFERTQDQLEHGIKASNAFYAGLEAYNQGALPAALDAFAEAATLNPDYLGAFEWAGTLSLELGRPNEAVTYWQRALRLVPDSVQARENLELAQAQVRWGVQAVTRYRDGVRLLEQNRLSAARDALQAATHANGRFADAWAQLGQVERELGNFEAAVQAFERAAVLEPDETSYQQQARALQDQLRAQTEAAEQPLRPAASEPAISAPATTEAAPKDPQTTPAADSAQQVSNTPPDMTQTGGEPLTLLGATFTHYGDESRQEAAFSFFETKESLTFDFRNPANYARGTLYQRLEVLSKPSDEVVQYQVCLVPADDITVAPACSNPAELTFTGRGTYQASQPLTSLSNYSKVDWSKGVESVLLVLRDDNGNPVSSSYLYKSKPTLDFSAFYPMSVNYSAVIVPEGAVFTGWPEQVSRADP